MIEVTDVQIKRHEIEKDNGEAHIIDVAYFKADGVLKRLIVARQAEAVNVHLTRDVVAAFVNSSREDSIFSRKESLIHCLGLDPKKELYFECSRIYEQDGLEASQFTIQSVDKVLTNMIYSSKNAATMYDACKTKPSAKIISTKVIESNPGINVHCAEMQISSPTGGAYRLRYAFAMRENSKGLVQVLSEENAIALGNALDSNGNINEVVSKHLLAQDWCLAGFESTSEDLEFGSTFIDWAKHHAIGFKGHEYRLNWELRYPQESMYSYTVPGKIPRVVRKINLVPPNVTNKSSPHTFYTLYLAHERGSEFIPDQDTINKLGQIALGNEKQSVPALLLAGKKDFFACGLYPSDNALSIEEFIVVSQQAEAQKNEDFSVAKLTKTDQVKYVFSATSSQIENASVAVEYRIFELLEDGSVNNAQYTPIRVIYDTKEAPQFYGTKDRAHFSKIAENILTKISENDPLAKEDLAGLCSIDVGKINTIYARTKLDDEDFSQDLDVWHEKTEKESSYTIDTRHYVSHRENSTAVLLNITVRSENIKIEAGYYHIKLLLDGKFEGRIANLEDLLEEHLTLESMIDFEETVQKLSENGFFQSFVDDYVDYTGDGVLRIDSYSGRFTPSNLPAWHSEQDLPGKSRVAKETTFAPTPQGIDVMDQLFSQVNLDPTGSIVVTKTGVDVKPLPARFWWGIDSYSSENFTTYRMYTELKNDKDSDSKLNVFVHFEGGLDKGEELGPCLLNLISSYYKDVRTSADLAKKPGITLDASQFPVPVKILFCEHTEAKQTLEQMHQRYLDTTTRYKKILDQPKEKPEKIRVEMDAPWGTYDMRIIRGSCISDDAYSLNQTTSLVFNIQKALYADGTACDTDIFVKVVATGMLTEDDFAKLLSTNIVPVKIRNGKKEEPKAYKVNLDGSVFTEMLQKAGLASKIVLAELFVEGKYGHDYDTSLSTADWHRMILERHFSKNKILMDRTKQESTEAAYRTAATQLTKLTVDPLLVLINSGNDPGMMSKLQEALSTETGRAALAGILSIAMTVAPLGINDPRITKLIEELRIQSMTTLGDELIDVFAEPLRMIAATTLRGEASPEDPKQLGENSFVDLGALSREKSNA